jgi:predicted DNA-binding transcriptional regulator AlpA
MLNLQPPSQRAIRLPELKNQTGLSRTTIYNKINPKSPHYEQGVIPFGGSFGYLESKDEPW